MPVWQDRIARVRQSVDRELGDEIRVLPKDTSTGGQYGGVTPDINRPEFDVVGVLRIGEGQSSNMEGGIKSEWKIRLPAGTAELRVDPARFPLALKVVEGDMLRAKNRNNQLFQVNRVDRLNRLRVVFTLTLVGLTS